MPGAKVSRSSDGQSLVISDSNLRRHRQGGATGMKADSKSALPTLISSCIACLQLAPACGDYWPGWRGPRGNGVSAELHAPVTWSPTENVRWKADLPGEGVGQPVVWQDRIFLTASDGQRHDQLHFLCLDRHDG